VAHEHALLGLLRLVVDRLAEFPRVAQARVWLVQRSEDCTGCLMAPVCPDRSACLHLAASKGRSAAEPGTAWTRLDGAFRRFPLGVRKAGRIAATGEPTEVPDLSPAPPAADRVLTDAEVRRLEADNIRAALRLAKGKVSGAGARPNCSG